ncbi:LOW QUALITY PROTEIN: hypothetical protein PanWU01x14_030300 [Parasponia andersonii]|uniref:Uncharacterized protein n=1 Tax=Parasponia andersonii TaxID=3476 RepID=A0A2P5DUP9_PARAD|nr:LOW QUALITY PROTEIN: hypothetical protein PanWU01x14_030300 [Parasponia andersonii]
MNNYPLEEQVKISLACFVVHNFITMYNMGNPLLNKYNVVGATVAKIEGDPDPGTNDVDRFEVSIKDNDDVVQPRFRDQFDMGTFTDRLEIHM